MSKMREQSLHASESRILIEFLVSCDFFYSAVLCKCIFPFSLETQKKIPITWTTFYNNATTNTNTIFIRLKITYHFPIIKKREFSLFFSPTDCICTSEVDSDYKPFEKTASTYISSLSWRNKTSHRFGWLFGGNDSIEENCSGCSGVWCWNCCPGKDFSTNLLRSIKNKK